MTVSKPSWGAGLNGGAGECVGVLAYGYRDAKDYENPAREVVEPGGPISLSNSVRHSHRHGQCGQLWFGKFHGVFRHRPEYQPGLTIETGLSTRGFSFSNATWALVSEEIPCDEVGTIEVKGFHYPIQAYRVLGDETRFNES